MAEVMTKEAAEKELTGWLDFKKVRPKQREGYSNQFDLLVESMVNGDITLDSTTFVITQKLISPVEGLFTELQFQPRKTVGELQKITSSINPGDIDGRLNAIISCVTGKGISHLMKMYPEDFGISQAVAVFFTY
jgi:hypothetical protein